MTSGGAGDDEGIVGINVTPLVDVSLVLVIIFMVATPFMEHPSLPVSLPKAITAEGEERENITITITADGRYALNADVMSSPDALLPALQKRIAKSKEKYVIIRADEQVFHGRLLEAMRWAKEAGAKSLTIATVQKAQ